MFDIDAWLAELEKKRAKKKEQRREIASKQEELNTDIANEKTLDEMLYRKKKRENYRRLKKELEELTK